ncbi:hypothetical protein [Gimesia aquarii]|uniref:Uncharacterized protein n=1 Tax=Gimesia aquarii TaxID=2527964 RepID=A0A517VR89_9PLAN|nr:hypothetical protein [Gimesia aquarii]QDT95536.1 hypothetical protein V144x_09810 [Gimesia aquarii]
MPTDGTGIAGNFQERTSMEATPLYNISLLGKEARSMFDKLPLKALDGKKTYLTAFLTVVFSLSGMLLGEIETAEAIKLLLAAFGLVGIGHKLEKSLPIQMEIGELEPSIERYHDPRQYSDE